MEIKLTPAESEEYFFNALANGLGYIGGYGIELDFFKQDYERAASNLRNARTKNNDSTQVCYEEVLMQILRDGKQLTMIDHEGDGEYTRSIELKHVHERVQKTPIGHLINMVNENDDAETADVILQTVFFEEIIFG